MSSRLTAAGGSVTRGSMTVSGKWIASSSSSRSSRRIGPGRTSASAIARIRPGIDRARPVRADPLALEVVHDRRREDPVLVLADPLERPHELPRVGLRAADDARNQR